MSNAIAPDTSVIEGRTATLTLIEPDESDRGESKQVDESAEFDNTLKAPQKFHVRLDSLGVSLLDSFSLLRVFRQYFRGRVAYFRGEEGQDLTLLEAIEKAVSEMKSHGNADELMTELLTTDTESISFQELHDLWVQSREDAEFIWAQMKHDARQDFMSGHLAVTVFEPLDSMRSAWKRAQFLGIRDAFIDEYEPEGGVEITLIDLMSQAYFLQQYWTAEAVKRTRTLPYRQNEQFLEWLKYKYEHESGWDEIFNPGNWDRIHVSEFDCQMQAMELAEHYSRLFLSIVRQLDNHRLAKAKLRRLSLPKVTRSVLESERARATERREKLQQTKNEGR